MRPSVAGVAGSETPVIATRGLTKRYRGTDALVDLDLEVAPGEVVGYRIPLEALTDYRTTAAIAA